ncbi:hypothetical protein ABIQ69_11475 [Agromyces sp. G08B096]|uniref:Uncharacterized protein n=1 Tax=Agromyces sp. G08B096 TaxID=3156399 RepID=A0AAU7W455_9MICO
MAKYVLHYGGQRFETNDGRVLADLRNDGGEIAEGTVQFRLADDRWLTILVSPSIPMALEEFPEPEPARASRGSVRRIR